MARLEGAPEVGEGGAYASVFGRQLGHELLPFLSQTAQDLIDGGAALFGEVGDQGREGLGRAVRNLGKGPGVLEQLLNFRLNRQLRRGHLHLEAEHELHPRRDEGQPLAEHSHLLDAAVGLLDWGQHAAGAALVDQGLDLLRITELGEAHESTETSPGWRDLQSSISPLRVAIWSGV